MERSLTVAPDRCFVDESRPIEIIRDRLYWITDKVPPRNRPNSIYICIDQVTNTQDLTYRSFCADFGPLNLGLTYRFCIQLESLLNDWQYSSYTIYHYCSNEQTKRANSAYLMGTFQIIVLQKSAYESWQPFCNLSPFLPFRDASYSICTYECSIPHCLNAIELSIKLGWFQFRLFNIEEYEHYETYNNGDMNWIIPNKMLAFSCPAQSNYNTNGIRTNTPEDYAAIFKRIGVTTVIRLSKNNYDSARFTRYGIQHYDLYFPDGSVPNESIVKSFLNIAEKETGAIAVHCKAGLGRTGTLIGCYAMKHYNLSAADFIAWCRICRPGSVLGPQQQFLIEMQNKLGKWPVIESTFSPSKRFMREMTVEDRYKAVYGDQGQAQRLMSAKKSNQCTPTKESYREDYSPDRMKNTHSPEGFDSYKQYRVDSPLRRYQDDSPARRYQDDSPLRRYQDDSPARRYQDDSPLRRYQDDSPPRRYQDDSPPRSQASPKRYSGSYRDESVRTLPTRLFTTTSNRVKYV